MDEVLLGDTIYGTNQEGPAAADFATGKICWKAEGVGPGAVFFADGRLYFHGENGDVALAEASPDAYREKGRFTPPANRNVRTPRKEPGLFRSSPVAASTFAISARSGATTCETASRTKVPQNFRR